MDRLRQRIANLSPEKRKLLERLLAKEGGNLPPSAILPRPAGMNLCPLSFAQQRLWVLHQLDPLSPLYNIAFVLRFRGRIDRAVMRRAHLELLRRHEILRTTFPVVDSRPAQVIAPPPEVVAAAPEIDLTGLPSDQREAKLQELAAVEALRPFDLARGPLHRETWVRMGETDEAGLFTLHHIVTDGWSLRIVLQELVAVYEAFAAGKPSPLPSLPIQYADYALWQREQLQGERLARLLDYWKGRLNGLRPLELPADRPRSAVASPAGGRIPAAVEPPMVEALRQLSRAEGTTLFMTLLAALKVLLCRLSGQDDLAVASPVVNRSRKETEGLIGFFINTLVLRTDLSGDPTFRQLLGRVRQTALGAYEHEEIPFEKLVDEIQPARDPSRQPLAQALFSLDREFIESLERPDLTLSGKQTDTHTSPFDLLLLLREGKTGLHGFLEFRRDLFDESTVARWLGHFRVLLEAIAADPDRRISELPLVGPTERRQVLVEWNDTAAPEGSPDADAPGLPAGCSLHHFVEAHAERTPDAIALSVAGRKWSYAMLNARANRLAHRLRALGVGPEVLVGIHAGRRPNLVVAILAVLKAGGAFLPLDPALPRERLAFLLEDAGPAVVLTGRQLRRSLPRTSIPVLSLDADCRGMRRESEKNPGIPLDPDTLAYVIYTSGSTGVPKGVEVTHRGIANLARAQAEAFRVGPKSRVLQFAPLSFDAAVSELAMTFCAGATLVLARRQAMLPGEPLLRLLHEEAVSVLTLPPSVLAALPEAKLPALRTLVVAGETCPADLAARWAPGRHFVNAYGPTEATVCATLGAWEGGDRRPPIGRPLANTRVYVLDGRMQPVPVGVPGELYLGGIGLARGYLNRPGLTAERFVPDPFGTAPGARLYRTGDRGRWLPGGVLEFLGRTDHQVKVRGFRIELGEIEAVLAAHPQVAECAVLAREDTPGDPRLVAYAAGRNGQAPLVDDLRALVNDKLPEYMMPSAFVILPALPRTAAGKVDRQALPAPGEWRPEMAREYVAPRTPLETALASAWAEVLRVERVGVHDSFFELGGHSLLAAQLAGRLRKTVGIDVPLRALFAGPTVAHLARYLGEHHPKAVERLFGLDSFPEFAEGRQESLLHAAPDLEAEVVLDHSIQGTLAPDARIADPAHVFLTGATGFLGVFLLRELLEQTRAEVSCLVRASDEHAARERIRKGLQAYGLWDEALGRRIVAVPGDLSRPLFGLTSQRFSQLAAGVDAIYHNGALVHFLQPYRALKPANVGGTLEVLRLACRQKVKPVHYVSTIGVFGDLPRGIRPRERDVPAVQGVQGVQGGYNQSKWVAERLVALAGKRGLPVAIYRPGRIAWHSRTGVASADDFFTNAVRLCIRMGKCPRVEDGPVFDDITPVDYVSGAIVRLSRRQGSLGRAFHLVNPRPTDLRRVLDALRSFGFGVQEVPADEWQAELAAQVLDRGEGSGALVLSALLAGATSRQAAHSPGGKMPGVVDCQETVAELAAAGLSCPEVTTDLLHRFLAYCVRAGLVEAPASHEPRPPLSPLERLRSAVALAGGS
jgi:amino acid adenylation domain-containing protein/thioester reductase-like protein